MMRMIFIFVMTFSSLVFAEWTNKVPQKATVWSFDQNCVELKLEDGSSLRVQKKALKLQKLEPHKTTIEFHLDALEKELCQK
jgi:hypothetical protein